MARNKHCCGRHYSQLPDHLREELSRSAVVAPTLEGEIVQFFEERLIGDHEIARCKFCGEDIVFLVTKRGHPLPVNAGDVEPEDSQFIFNKHARHKDSCANFGKQA